MTEILANQSVWYGITALLHALLAGVLFARGGGLLRGNMLIVAACGIAWSAYFALLGAERISGVGDYALDTPAAVAEILLLLAWFLLLFRLLRGPYRRSMPEAVRRALLLFWLFVLLAGGIVFWQSLEGQNEGLVAGYYAVIAGGVALMCFGLAAQLNHDAPVENTLTLRLLVTAGGLVAGAGSLVLGVAALTGTAPQVLLSVRLLAVGAAALLLLFVVRRQPQWSLEIFVSPRARTYLPRFVPMLVVLVALLALKPLGIQQALAVTLLTLAGIPITLLMFSEHLSARLRVFISKHFLPFRFDYREEWLRLIDTLAAPEQRMPLPERSIKAVAQIVGAPAGLLWWRDNDQQPYRCSATWNTRMWPGVEVGANDPALKFMCARQWIIDTAELERDPDLYDGLTRPEWTGQLPEGVLIVPLISNEALLGFIVLFHSSSAFRLAFEEIDLLRTAGRQVAAHLAQYEGDKQLAEAQQFEAFNRLTAFVMHDLKNLIAQQSLLVENAAKHKDKPEFIEDSMNTIENSVARMNKLLRQLQSGDTSRPAERVLLSEALRDAIDRSERRPDPEFVNEGGSLTVSIDRERFTAVVTHLIRNAQEATSGEGAVTVRLQKQGKQAVIRIEDDGCGMPAEFIRNRLFRPFDSTKGSQGMGIGAYQARLFVTEAGGSLEVESEPDRGTVVMISLPAEP